MSHEERLQQVRFLARIMDEQFVIPGTGLRFGWDSVLGLFPRSLALFPFSSFIMPGRKAPQASFLRECWPTLAWILVLGAVPLVGDAFDFRLEGQSQKCPAAGTTCEGIGWTARLTSLGVTHRVSQWSK
jgi:hypothetical protein